MDQTADKQKLLRNTGESWNYINCYYNCDDYILFYIMAAVRWKMKSLVRFLRVLSSELYFSYCTFNASYLLFLMLFADDTNVFMSHKDPNCLLDMLNLEMDKLSIWFKANKLSLNLNKTKFMVFKPRQKRTICNIQISIKTFNKDRSINLPQFKT